jgi:predicted enzyme related to lactoylglutathione lyase
MNPVVHFEMPAEDGKRMAAFYANVFAWKTQMLGPEMGDYVIATTTESDEKQAARIIPAPPTITTASNLRERLQD